jgi:CBS domain-containing protein
MEPQAERKAGRVVLDAQTAQDLMTPQPVTISERATITAAVELPDRRGISTVPVADAAGRPVGVRSRADIVRHTPEQSGQAVRAGQGCQQGEGGPCPHIRKGR